MNIIQLNNISDYLGPTETRFFSAGYRRPEYYLHQLKVFKDTSKIILETYLDISYPSNWSKKGNTNQIPHLSTIDTLVLGMRLCEYLSTIFIPIPVEFIRIGDIRIQSSNSPQENLEKIPVVAELAVTKDSNIGKYKCRIGTLKISFDVSYPSSSCKISQFNSVLQKDNFIPKFWEDGFRHVDHSITDVLANCEDRIASAKVNITVPMIHDQEIAARTKPLIPLTEAFVISVQLVQVLLYEIDGLSRSESNTLWMLKTKIMPRNDQNLTYALSNFPAKASITCKEKIILNQQNWSYIEFSSCVGDVKIESSFAHDITQKNGMKI